MGNMRRKYLLLVLVFIIFWAFSRSLFNNSELPLTYANNQFCFDFYSTLKEGDKGNIFFSPFSISASFAMSYEGARGKTSDEIRAVFRFLEDKNLWRSSFSKLFNEITNRGSKSTLSIANALWVQKDYKLLADYMKVIEKYYRGKASNVDFVKATERTRQMINNWVEERTNQKIKELFPAGSLNSRTRLAITNAIYFKGLWVKQFNKEETREANFHVSKEKIVKVPMMSMEEDEFNYGETKDLQILEMVYEGERFSMIILLPRNSELENVERTLSYEKIKYWKSLLKRTKVNVYFPKLTLNTKYNLNENLKKMGMNLAFSELADFSGMDGTNNLYIQVAIHQAFVDVNEEGTEAAGATGVAVGLKSIPVFKIFCADRPFIFLIQDRATGIILFLGRVVNPKE